MTRRAFAAMLASTFLAGASAQAAAPARQLVLTFDDLPYAAQPFPQSTEAAARATRGILSVLAEFRAPAIGFVNEQRLYRPGEVDAGIALLKSWLDGGAMLGNHSFSHPSLNRMSPREFEDDIVRGEGVLNALMRNRGPYQKYFRFPYNHTGPTAEVKQRLAAFLAERGYRIAPHTIDTSDYLFNLPYLDAVRRADAAIAQRVRAAYLDYSMTVTTVMEQIAPQVFGRDIPQVLLLHANDINADSLAEMLGRYRDRGYTFVSLDQAMADEAYATPDIVTTTGAEWLWRWSRSKGLNISFRGDPGPPPWVRSLYENLASLPNDPSNVPRY
jgi:peptidoglycan/xylan/chitin deacetylase (PgdA/CDA1 family)